MSNDLNKLIKESVPSQEAANDLMKRFLATTRPEAVFSAPVTAGDFTVITASELFVGMGYGFGGGGGMGGEETSAEGGFGSGGGGGGTAQARPIAMIEIGPAGVRVEPIVDATKIAIAFFTTLGAMFMALMRMKRKSA